MNEQEQQIAIAEVTGRKQNYLHDLNAMREALTSLTAAQQDVYACFLGSITGGRSIDFGAKCVNATTAILFASAAQQAEAFLRAIGKWKKTHEAAAILGGLG